MMPAGRILRVTHQGAPPEAKSVHDALLDLDSDWVVLTTSWV